jgi:kynurenine 3-monooxygenase
MRQNKAQAAIVGAGLVGSLLSIFLARRGHRITMYERRADMRRESIAAGRSINLAISSRGLHALKLVGLESEVLKRATPMRGRMMHSPTGELTFQRYGRDDSEYINSISRGDLNKILMTAAEETGRVRIEFHHAVEDLSSVAAPMIFGADGSSSVVRRSLAASPGFTNTEIYLEHGYKELAIPAGPGGNHRLERNALHIWPRGTYMLIALPNFDGSFTCTLFLPFKGAVSFEAMKTGADVSAFFAEHFADALPLMEGLEEEFFAHPTGHMVTVKCAPWNDAARTLLLGDAAHAIVPFFGQGMNCGFEDCEVLDGLLERYSDRAHAFEKFFESRKPNSDAIADMAVENFIEMRDKVADKRFLLEKAVEHILQEKFPDRYVPRYALVTFSRVPYKFAYDAGIVQAGILKELCRDLARPEEVDLRKAEQLINERLRDAPWNYSTDME